MTTVDEAIAAVVDAANEAEGLRADWPQMRALVQAVREETLRARVSTRMSWVTRIRDGEVTECGIHLRFEANESTEYEPVPAFETNTVEEMAFAQKWLAAWMASEAEVVLATPLAAALQRIVDRADMTAADYWEKYSLKPTDREYVSQIARDALAVFRAAGGAT